MLPFIISHSPKIINICFNPAPVTLAVHQVIQRIPHFYILIYCLLTARSNSFRRHAFHRYVLRPRGLHLGQSCPSSKLQPGCRPSKLQSAQQCQRIKLQSDKQCQRLRKQPQSGYWCRSHANAGYRCCVPRIRGLP